MKTVTLEARFANSPWCEVTFVVDSIISLEDASKHFDSRDEEAGKADRSILRTKDGSYFYLKMPIQVARAWLKEL